MIQLLTSISMPFAVVIAAVAFVVYVSQASIWFFDWLAGNTANGRCATMRRKEGKPIVQDTLLAEAYSLCDRMPNAYMAGTFRGEVDRFAQQIAECHEKNLHHAELCERRRLADLVQRMRMGS